MDISGKRFGALTVIKKVSPIRSPSGCIRTVYECKCDCGNVVNVPYDALVHKGRSTKTSCGCKEHPFEDLSGRRFGKLTVIKRTDDYDEFFDEFPAQREVMES